jgi:hypothetical protein
VPIRCSFHPDWGRLVAVYVGRIDDEELLSESKAIYADSRWIPGMDELHDLSLADLSGVSAKGIRQLAAYSEDTLRNRGVESLRIAVYAPAPLPFGLARMYEAMAADSPESIRVCQSIEEAEAWLKA